MNMFNYENQVQNRTENGIPIIIHKYRLVIFGIEVFIWENVTKKQ
jgi:hypothetical protein